MTDITFEVYEDSKSEGRWRAKAENGLFMADSGEGYSGGTSAAEEALQKIIAAVKEDRYVVVNLGGNE